MQIGFRVPVPASRLLSNPERFSQLQFSGWWGWGGGGEEVKPCCEAIVGLLMYACVEQA